MSIKFACQCGRSFTVADSFGGKWTRCSSCNTKMQVPAAASADDGGWEVVESPAAVPPPLPLAAAPAPAGPISFSCKCGQPLEMEAEFAGQEVECPTCQKVVRVPSPQPLLAKRATRPAAAAVTVEDDEPPPKLRRQRDDDEDDDDTPRRKRPSATDKYMRDARRKMRDEEERDSRSRGETNSSRMIALVIGGLMVLGGIGLFVLMMQGGGRFRIGPILLVVFGLMNVVYGLTGQEE